MLSGSLVFEAPRRRRRREHRDPRRHPSSLLESGTRRCPFDPVLPARAQHGAFFETLFALAQRGDLDHKGMPKLLPLAALAKEFADEIRPVSLPWPLVRALAATLGPIARRRGYHGRFTLMG